MKKLLWIMICCIMVLSLIIASCGGDEEEEKTSTEKEDPEYGGTITIMSGADPDPDLLGYFACSPQHIAHNSIWDGDWTKGPAGGYGTSEVLWEESTNVPELNEGYIAESYRFVVNAQDQTVDSILTIRDNIYFAQPDTEAGRLVGGRKMTTDDVVWCIEGHLRNPESDNYAGFPECRDVPVVKTGPNEITITHPIKIHVDSTMRLFSYVLMYPKELWDTYGLDSTIDLNLSVGTGSFYVKEYIPSNTILMERNPNYWKTDPIGPGMGNQLPYADKVKFIIIPDSSTQQAALRTAGIDRLTMLKKDDADMLVQQNPALKIAQRGGGHEQCVFFRMDSAPFDDVRVRKAMQLAVNLDEINESLYEGEATYFVFPYYYTPAYADLYLGMDDPAMPADVKELYTYNPTKAKQLLADAGYPDGFKTELTIVSLWADYYSILKEYWAAIGVDVELVPVQDFGALIGTNASLGFEGMIAQFISPCSTYPEQAQYTGDSWLNPSRIKDPYVTEMAEKARAACVTSMKDGMAVTKELTAYLLKNVYAVQALHYPLYNVWWPWLKNYTGESSVGYMTFDSWVQFVWVDQDLKASMGY